MQTTSVSLLERLRKRDEQEAWERFVQLYSPLLSHWARRLGLDGQDADDLVQDVFIVLVQKLPEFRYDASQHFRGWLWTVIHNKWRERGRRPAPPTPTPLEALDGATEPDVADVVSEAEYQAYLLKRALELGRGEFQETTWRAFWECVVADRSTAEVALELGLSENAVYLAKGRVLRRLRQELAGLLD